MRPMWSEPIARLPERVCFTLAETGRLLFSIDVAVRLTAPESSGGRLARAAQRVVTRRLWPELGRLLEDDDGEEA